MTGDERSAFFAQVDACRPAGGCAAYRRPAGGREAPSRAACRRGPRDSEARGVPGDRAGPDAGASAMARSKGRRDRVAHVADDLTAPCPGCLAWPRGLPGPRPGRLLPSRDPGRPLADTSAGRALGRPRDATAFAPGRPDRPVARGAPAATRVGAAARRHRQVRRHRLVGHPGGGPWARVGAGSRRATVGSSSRGPTTSPGRARSGGPAGASTHAGRTSWDWAPRATA